MLFTTNWLTTVFTDCSGDQGNEKEIKSVTIDSRQKSEDALFIPIIGENFDGHDFVEQAYQNGAIAILWDRKRKLPEQLTSKVYVYYVDDTTSALQELASCYRDKVNPIVIGVTGSNGKTTTKDIVASIAKQKYRTHYTNGNFNNEIGLPLTVLAMEANTEVLVLEMGMSSFGEIELLSKLAKPDYAIITNIGESHIEFLGSREGIAKAKLEITSGLSKNGKLIVDGDEPLLASVHHEDHVVTAGFESTNDFVISSIEINRRETTFVGSDGNTYSIPLLGNHHAKNASYGIVIGALLGISFDQIQAAFHGLTLTGMRFELLTGRHGVSIINDAYNASPTSMKAAIQVVNQIPDFKEKVLVLGDIYELGSESKSMHEAVAEVIDNSITALFTVGEDSKVISDVVQLKYPMLVVAHFHQKEDVLEALQPYLKQDALLLFKASRGMKLESLIEAIKAN
ncbi:UDP-N-acetylmuramoyl-tripeptide--D-alanyl-D-alanine ligase [Ornithinibacillus contaminans]|uniref:UDP-N-acetylmuramoyl-tripeptide--D-alanyl-D- alanine ligase n=1 Tax=Ornithinibacillus contaminans TaxID=694055 RepID=UPI00064DBD83|nr:UDP-N-acetylmuramoyl-tripeptide--D-alanyl-D-alanine ligase [Ornithinibacillus contaminans]